MLVYVRLHEDGAALGVESAGDQRGVELACALAQLGRILWHGDGVQVDDAIDVVVDILFGDPVLDRADIVADRRRSRRLDAGEDALALRLASLRRGSRCR